MKLAHDLSESSRTVDVAVGGEVTFSGMMLSDQVLQGLTEAGFRKPSPVQLQAIPIGRCGFDLIVEAKSGTGKTAVFGIISLEMIEIRPDVQVLILAPTREIAVQVCEVIRTIGSAMEGLYVETVMGGTSCHDDIKRFSSNSIPQIVVGSPGRLRHLVQQNVIDTSAVSLLVLDEADKLMEGSFQADINYINSKLEKKQVIAASATYSDELRTFIGRYMKSPSHVRPDNSCILLGVSQSITLVKHHDNVLKQIEYKYVELKDIISSVNFKQCLVFCNYQARSKKICTMLKRDGWPAEYLSGCQTQDERLRGLRSLQEFKCRVLVATDLAARGLDASNVDLVINFEPPYEVATYLHRIGRAGRYGSYGSAITILSHGAEEAKFKKQIKSIEHSIQLTDFRSKLVIALGEEQVDDVKCEVTSCEQTQCSSNSVLDHEVEMGFNFEELLDSFNNTKSTPVTTHHKNTEFPTFKSDEIDTINLMKLSACVESLLDSHTNSLHHSDMQPKKLPNDKNMQKGEAELATSIDRLNYEVESSSNGCTDTFNIVQENCVPEIKFQENYEKRSPISYETYNAHSNGESKEENELKIDISLDPEISSSSKKARTKPKRGSTRNNKKPVRKSKFSLDENINREVDLKKFNANQINGQSFVERNSSCEEKSRDFSNDCLDNHSDVCENQSNGVMSLKNNAHYFANILQTSDSEHEGPIQVEDKHKKIRIKHAGQRQRTSHSTHQYWDKIEQMTASLANMDYESWRAQLAVMTAQIEQSVYITELCNQNT